MNKEVRKLWTDALESGKYKQGRDRLRTVDREDGNSFCCLGVLCEVAVEAGIIPEPVIKPKNYDLAASITGAGAYGLGDEADEAELPITVSKWAGLIDEDEGRDYYITDPYIQNQNGDSQACSVWNDTDRKSFIEIADMIKRSL